VRLDGGAVHVVRQVDALIRTSPGRLVSAPGAEFALEGSMADRHRVYES
jgi:hypothetical protein